MPIFSTKPLFSGMTDRSESKKAANLN